jgi:arylsulfatase A-like enzyme
MLSALDDGVGALLQKLRTAGLEDNTLIFFISDNGGPETVNASNNGPLRGQKAQTWEGGIRVPFFVQWKGKIPGGRTVDHPVIQLDIGPTALAAAGIDPPTDTKLDGVNLLPYAAGDKKDPPHEILFWRFGAQIAVRKGDWKLVKAPGQGTEGGERRTVATDAAGAGLFNLAEDIGEQTDLAAKNPDIFKELETAWKQWNSELIDPKWRPGQGKKKKAKQKT